MSTHDAGARIGRQGVTGGDPEPSELPTRIGVLALEGFRQPDTGETRGAVGSEARLGALQVGAELVATQFGQQGRSVLGALATAYEDQSLIEIDILDPQLAAFRDPQPAAVDQRGHQPGRPAHGSEQRGRLGQRRKLAALGLLSTFDVALISEAEGVRKPSAEIFRRALQMCEVEAGESVFAGDHPETDIEGARHADLLPIWKRVPYRPLVTADVLTVHRLVDILAICLRE